MIKYLLKLKWLLILSVILSVINATINASMLLFPGLLIDNYSKGMSYIQKMLTVYVVLFLVYLLNAYLSNRAADYRRILFEKALKKDFFDAVIGQNFESFHQRDIGEYISLQTNDITEMCMNYMNPLFFIIDSSVMILIFGAALIKFVNFYVAVAIIAFSVIVVFIPRITGGRVAKRNEVYLNSLGKYTSTVKTLYESHAILDRNSRRKIMDLHEDELETVMKKHMQYRRLNSFAFVLNGGSVEAVALIVFAVVALLLSRNQITLGMATIAFSYSTKFMDPMYDLNTNIGTFLSVRGIKEKLLGIIAGCEKEKENTRTITSIATTELKKSYDDVKIQIAPVQFLAFKKYLIRGENGAGKSVFFRLLMNFERPDEGRIFYNGDTHADGIDQSICYVPQVPVIFDASYEDNISIYHSFDLGKLPKYENYFPKTVIEHIKQNLDIRNLSGGEKQVVAILRALCSEKQILLMDEPFAAMNQMTIDVFMGHMKEIHKTILIIAHNIDDYSGVFDEEILIERK